MYGAAQTQNRIKHRTYRVGKWTSIDNRHRAAEIMPAPQESRAIRLVLQFSNRFAFRAQHVRNPNRRLLFGSLPARRQNGSDVRDKLRFHKQIGKSRVRYVRRLGSE